MRILSLIDNVCHSALHAEHGLSLHISLHDGTQLLFDMGQDELFAENARNLGVNLADVEMAFLSHGHFDHGGGMHTFLQLNRTAHIYVQRRAFEPHYSLHAEGMTYVGLPTGLAAHPQIIFCDDTCNPRPELLLFSHVSGKRCYPAGNSLLFGPTTNQPDDFVHEQSLLIKEDGRLVLFAGCAHTGLLNIMERAVALCGKAPTHVFAGMHLMRNDPTDKADAAFLQSLASGLQAYSDTQYFTMHCTGEYYYTQLHHLMGNQIRYLACGEQATTD